MAPSEVEVQSNIRYEASDKPPIPLTAGLGLQMAILCIGGIVLTVAIVVRAGGGTEAFLSWGVFVAVLISGITTIIQAVKFGRVGAGYVLLMGTSGAFIAVCITALAQGGPGMLCTLIVISSLTQFILAYRLSWLRRILTPTVAGTVIMLIAVTVMPIIFNMLADVPDGTTTAEASSCALITILVVVLIALKGRGSLRLWAPVIAVIIGTVIAIFLGFYDVERVKEADWIGVPEIAWPGLDLSFNATFWALLPGFIFVTLVGAIETIGDSVAIQRVSWRNPRAVDFRAVQGAVTADSVGNLLSGLGGTVPNTTYSSSVSVTELTGVASRRVGVAIGIIFILLAFFPKFLAVILAIPGPVVAAYLSILISMLFVVGMKIVIHDGIDYRKGIIVGVSFWVGVGFQAGVIYPEIFTEFASGLLLNGMTAGGLLAVLMTLFIELTQPRRKRIQVDFDVSALASIQEFLTEFAVRHKWDSIMETRLQAVAEETLFSLLREDTEAEDRRIQLVAHKEDGGAVLEFVSATGESNLEDQLALLNEGTGSAFEASDVSLRLLQHLASTVRHQQYHNAHIITVHVDVPPQAARI